jgi:transposase
MPRNKRTGRIRETNSNERTRIIELRGQGHNYAEIEAMTGIGHSTCQRVVDHWEKTRDNTRQPRHGTKPKLDDRDIRHLARLSNAHPRATLAEITNEVRVPIKPRTVGKYLRAANLWVRLARRKPYLNVVNQKKRKTWCREKRKWEKRVWRNVIYTDEAKIQTGTGTDARRKVRRPRGNDSAVDPRFLQPTFIGNVFGVWFWAAITYGKHTPLVAMGQRTEKERTSEKDKLGFNSQQYVDEILTPYLAPLYEECGGIGKGVQTVEDGASYHTSTYSCRHRLQLGVRKMEWPPHSPDLNPIENVWALMKTHYRQEVWRTKKLPRNEEELIEVAQRVWEGLPWPKVYRMIDSMPSRVAACLRRNGGPTRY